MKILGYNFSVKKNKVLSKTENSPKTGRRNPAIVKIAQSFKDNSRKDIDKWRMALQLIQHPEEPKFAMYYDLVDDLLTDGHLQSQIQMRKMSTLNTDFQVINRNTGGISDKLTYIFQQQWFYEFLDQAMDSILFGTTLIEFSEFNNEKVAINYIPRRNVVSTQNKIFPDLQKPQFIDYSDDSFKKWLLQIGKSGDIGIINNIIPNLIWLRNVMQSWAEFCEKFGLPLITATTATTDSTTIDNVHEMLLNLSEASVGTFPHGTVITFQEANRTDAYQTYLNFIQTNADIISKQLVGSTMLSDQGTNRSQTEVHERSLDNKIAQADKRLISFIINDQLFPLLKEQGYSINETDVFEFKTAEQEIKLTELWNITNGLLSSGHEIQTDWLSKTFNIPIESKKKSLTPKTETQALATFNNRYDVCNCCEHEVTALGGKIGKVLQTLTNDLIKQLYGKKNTAGTIGKMIVAEALELLSGLRSKFKTASPYVGQDLLALQLMEYNLFEFTASKTEARLASMTDLLIDKETKKLREFNEFEELCQKAVKSYNKEWLLTEYNLSVAVGQNAAAYHRFMAEKDTVTSFVKYQTVGDNKVRASHSVLDGKIFNLSDKEAMDLFPPNGYGCRCEFVQYLGKTDGKVIKGKKGKELLAETDPKYFGSQFEINRGDLKQVFTKKQFYSDIKGLPERLNDMTFDKYELKKYADFKDTLKNIKLDKTITENNVKELFKKVKGKNYMGFEDYLGRKMILSETSFDTHTQGYYLNSQELRHQLFPHVKKTLKKPDEVWLFKRKTKLQKTYITFYKDKALCVVTEIKADALHIKTWFSMKEKTEKGKRKGLLIKKGKK